MKHLPRPPQPDTVPRMHPRARLALSAAYASQPITPDMVQRTKAYRAAHPDSVEPQTGLEKRSKDSAAMLPYWDKVDAIIDGIDGLRACGEQFLPRFRDEDGADYNYRLTCTKVTNVYRDILEGLSSKPFEEQVRLIDDSNPPQIYTDFIEDVDGSSNTLSVFASQVFFNGINNAIDWIFVDHSNPETPPTTMAEYRAQGNRVYWSHVLARNVLDVQSKVIGGVETITYFKMLEPGDPDHIREFRLTDGQVTWTLFRKEPTATQVRWVREDGGVVSIGVIPMVPFITGRRVGRTWKVDPPLKDAADLQIELYQQESGLKFAKNLTCYPMLAANGIAPEKDANGKAIYKIAVGPNRVLFTGTNNAGHVGSWSYLEPSSESLKFLKEDIDATIQQLRELGRQPLTASSSNITVITAMVAALKAKSAVKAWALLLKDALENALLLTDKWLRTEYIPNVHVFVAFSDFMEGEDLDALSGARTNKDISRETYWSELKRRGVLSSDFDPVREEARLLSELPGDPDEVIDG